jgi:thiol-disulfide isomerase/thioredoxin
MQFIKVLTALLCFLYTSTTVLSQNDNGPLVDKLAPPLYIKESLNQPYNSGFVEKKVMVIDFWATWCAPCIAGFPYFNYLASKFSHKKNVVFATVTDEDKQKVELFFKRTKKELHGLRLLDDSSKTMEAFQIHSIPLAVVIDDHGFVRWSGETQSLREGIIDSILKKIPLTKEVTVQSPKPYIDDARKFINTSSFKILFAKSLDTSRIDNSTGGWATSFDDYSSITYTRKKLIDFLALLLNTNAETRFKIKNKEKGDYKVDVFFTPRNFVDSSYSGKYVEGRPNLNLLVDMLSKAFKFDLSVKTENLNGYKLVCNDTFKLKEFKTLHSNPQGITHASESDVVNGSIEFANKSLNEVLLALEIHLKVPIINMVKVSTNYDMTINVKSIDEANTQLSKYGLALIESRDEMFKTVHLNFK